MINPKCDCGKDECDCQQMARRKASPPPQNKNFLDPKLIIQVGMIAFAAVGFYYTTKSRLDIIESNMQEMKSSLTDSRMVKVEMNIEQIEKDIEQIDMSLKSLEDWLLEELDK